MRFRPAIFIAFVFAQFFFKFYNNDGNQKLKACSFQLRKNYFCMLHIECPIARQSSITIFLIHPVYHKSLWFLESKNIQDTGRTIELGGRGRGGMPLPTLFVLNHGPVTLNYTQPCHCTGCFKMPHTVKYRIGTA